MGFIDPAFKNIKIGQSYFAIWRVENFELKTLPNSLYGNFHEGDCYIIYAAASPSGKFSTKDFQGRLEYHIHFWLGSKSSIDESATAAIKVVELDEILNGMAVQHREIQGHESNKFKSYFKKGIRILRGGVASGLHHVSDAFTSRLFKIKGQRRPVMIEQPEISWEYFNSGDAFILELKDRIFIWIGKESNKMERFQAGKVASHMKDERPRRSIIVIEEDKEFNLEKDELIEFEKYLPLNEKIIQPSDGCTDSQIEKQTIQGIKLYKCTNENGTFDTVFVKEGPLKQTDLNTMDSYIIVNSGNGVWIWIGKKASEEERTKGMEVANEFLKNVLNSDSACVTRVVENAEPLDFQMLFVDWKDPNASIGYPTPSAGKKTVNIDFDAAKLHESPIIAANTQLIDNGTGKVQVWRLHNKDLEPVPEEQFGLFFSGDCYLILYTYDCIGREKYLLYYWLGAHSSQDERGTVAWHAIKKDEELNGAAIQVRVVQSKEDPQFLMIFKGKIIIFKGGYASSFDGPEGKNVGVPSKFLIQVRGGDKHSTQATEVKFSASSLNTNDVFVLYANRKAYVWCGKGSTGDERERAKEIANKWSPTKEHTVLFEGQESEEFWQILGGRQPYAKSERLAQPKISYPARLFHCSNATGYFRAEEIVDFSQYDLVPNDVMILDIGNAIFIWVGKGANEVEKSEAPKLVKQYLNTDPRGRDLECPIITVQQGFEPPNFTGFFGAWDEELWKASLYRELMSEVPQDTKVVRFSSFTEDTQKTSKLNFYPLSELANKSSEELPDDVSVTHRELHLTDEDFESAFGMSRKEFDSLPTWKQNNLKKEVGLF